MSAATATGPAATVDVAHEAGTSRVGPRTDGADLRVTIGEPLRLAILGGRDSASVAAAYAAALAANVEVVLALTTAAHGSLIDRATALRDARPDAVIIVAEKRDQDATIDLIEALRLARGSSAGPIAMLVAAEERTRVRIAATAGPMAMEAIPGPLTEHAREAIVARLRGMRRGAGEIVLRDEAIEAAARALAASSGRSTLIVDVSGSTTSLALASTTGTVTAVHARLGIGPGADRIVAGAGLDRVRRWIPRAIDAPALLERVFNRARWPDAVAPSASALALEMALAREALAHLLREAQRAGLDLSPLRAAQTIVATGDLARLPRPSQTTLVILDALGPTGTHLVAREHPDALVVAGAIATRTAADVAGTTEDVALVATLWPKRTSDATVIDAAVRSDERIGRGSFVLVPTDGPVELRIKGVRRSQRAGPLSLGVVFDARGRPLDIPARDAERLPTISRWHTALAALPLDEAGA
ncbi:MAG TPA: hypothetical protein VM052_08130 [Candidatus Limnocylindrales bacterium]|nr:hypothetical protein [Candidatus Limnocylindrales bacterium]